MWKSILIWALNWIITNGGIRVYTSAQPIGKRIGGADIPDVRDQYLVIQFVKDDLVIWSGYWQLS